MLRQKTIKNSVTTSGIGLHSGRLVNMRLLPAAANHGVVFRRVDLNPVVEIPARADLVKETMLCTGLVKDNAQVATIEHLMSALAGLGIDNIIVELDAGEVPIMDGSASPFVFLLQSAGIRDLDAEKRFIRLMDTVEVRDGDKFARLLPFSGFRIDFTIDFNHPVLSSRNQCATVVFSTENYIRQVCRARTFGFVKDIEYLRNHHLALGGSLDNAIVIDDYRILNESGLRSDDEFVKHKILDAIGDLYTLGAPLLAWYQGYKSGHALNNRLCMELLRQKHCWQWDIFEAKHGDKPLYDALDWSMYGKTLVL